MDQRATIKTSKFLSLVLRHRPEIVGITLDDSGWTEVETLLDALKRHGRPLSRTELEHVVAANSKRRFAFSDDGRRIRASQGHSVEVDLQYEPLAPPELLYHGTAERNLSSIRRDGLHRGRRHHVHLSPDAVTARTVGQRHGRPVVLVIRAGAMHAAGHLFYLSANGVWLTESVPPEYVEYRN